MSKRRKAPKGRRKVGSKIRRAIRRKNRTKKKK